MIPSYFRFFIWIRFGSCTQFTAITVVFFAAIISAEFCCAQADPDASKPAKNTEPQKDGLDRNYSNELPRFPPLDPQEALDSMEVLDGFRVELVAAEPLVTDPIAFAFDARGRLFVVEMRDYSEQDKEHLGRVALLEDTNVDGQMDKRSTFIEGLSWPTALHPWKDGVLVAAPPYLKWFRDTNADGKADTSEEWFVGFGRNNVQGMVNSLRWGVDGFLHGATSSTGARLEVKKANQSQLSLSRTDFAIDTLRKKIHPVSGGGQHGPELQSLGRQIRNEQQ